MAGNKYLSNVGGVLTEVVSSQTSAGAGDAGKIPALDASGRLDNTLMPVGAGTETDQVTTSEALNAGDFVNLWNSTGLKARKADATTAGKEAHGFVLAAAGSGSVATVYRISQSNTGVTGMTVGAKQYLATTAGGRTETAPSASGNVVQILGVALSATQMSFMPQPPITLA